MKITTQYMRTDLTVTTAGRLTDFHKGHFNNFHSETRQTEGMFRSHVWWELVSQPGGSDNKYNYLSSKHVNSVKI
jgi:hypothetical protein